MPGAKQVWRRPPGPDILALRSEPGPRDHEPLLEPVMQRGTRIGPLFSLDTARERLARDLAARPLAVQVSERLRALADKVAGEVDGCTTPRPH